MQKDQRLDLHYDPSSQNVSFHLTFCKVETAYSKKYLDY